MNSGFCTLALSMRLVIFLFTVIVSQVRIAIASANVLLPNEDICQFIQKTFRAKDIAVN